VLRVSRFVLRDVDYDGDDVAKTRKYKLDVCVCMCVCVCVCVCVRSDRYPVDVSHLMIDRVPLCVRHAEFRHAHDRLRAVQSKGIMGSKGSHKMTTTTTRATEVSGRHFLLRLSKFNVYRVQEHANGPGPAVCAPLLGCAPIINPGVPDH
jgi:hypothetical protein